MFRDKYEFTAKQTSCEDFMHAQKLNTCKHSTFFVMNNMSDISCNWIWYKNEYFLVLSTIMELKKFEMLLRDISCYQHCCHLKQQYKKVVHYQVSSCIRALPRKQTGLTRCAENIALECKCCVYILTYFPPTHIVLYFCEMFVVWLFIFFCKQK